MDFKKENLKRQDYYAMKKEDYNSGYTPSEKGVLIVSKFYNKSNPKEFWVKVYGGDYLTKALDKLTFLRIYLEIVCEVLRIYLEIVCEEGFVICDSKKKIFSVKQVMSMIEKAQEVEYGS